MWKLNKLIAFLFIAALGISMCSYIHQSNAAAKSRTALQTDIDDNKLRSFNSLKTHDVMTNVNDSAFNKSTDDLDDISDGTTNSLIPAADAAKLAATTSSAAELNLLDGSLEANTAASVAPILDTAKALRTNANVGTAGTGVTAVEYGDGYNHVTVLTLTAAALTPTTIPADAEGAGVIAYTFPAGVHLFTACHMDITAFTGTGFAATNAVDMGIGSLISSGDIATLTTAAMEDCVTGQTVADISSPATEKSTIATAGAPLLFESGGSKVIHLNVAGTWNDTFTAPVVTGTITLYWTFLGA